MNKKKVLNIISYVCVVVGFYIGHITLGPLLDFLKPKSEYDFAIFSPGHHFEVVMGFRIFMGILLALVPFLGKYLSGSRTKMTSFFLLLSLAGFSGLLLSFLYLKLKHLRVTSVAREFGIESSTMQVPPMFLIPFAGIVLMLLAFVVLKYVFKNENIVSSV